jgi:hypothetical protein
MGEARQSSVTAIVNPIGIMLFGNSAIKIAYP